MNDKDLEYISDRLDNREIWINSEIDDTIVSRVMIHLQKWNSEDESKINPKPIKIFINTLGGSTVLAAVLADMLIQAKAEVHTYNVGYAVSAGLTIFLAGDKRFGYHGSVFMCHSSFGKTPYMKVQDLESYASYCTENLNDLTRYILARTKLTKNEIQQCYNKDRWFFLAEARKVGIVTDII